MNEKKQDFKYFKPMGDGSGLLLDVNKKPIYQSADCINWQKCEEDRNGNEIMIDGVNVAGCPEYERYLSKQTKEFTDICNGDLDSPYCEGNPNCQYKQLQRLKAENEELKAKIETYDCSAKCYKYIESDKYRQSLEEVRDLIDKEFYAHYKDVSFNDYDFIISKIGDKIREVLDERA